MSILQELKRLNVELLYSRLVRVLSNERVILEWRELEDYRGLTFKRDGDVIIQVDEDLDQEQEFLTILHEIAHVKLHASGLIDESAFDFLPEKASDYYPEWYLEKRKKAHEKREQEAKHQVDQWLENAGDGSNKDRIKNLLEFYSNS